MRERTVFGAIGIILLGLVGWLCGAIFEHAMGPGGSQFFGFLIGIMVALAVLSLGEALKSRE